MINLLLITLIIVFIIDLSGFVDNLKQLVKIIFNIKNDIVIKPFDCSLCMTFWCCLLYLLLTCQFNLVNILVTCLLAYSTSIIVDIVNTIRIAISVILQKINKLFL